MTTSLSRSRQLSSDQSAVAAEALAYQRERASAVRSAIDERRAVLDKVTADMAALAKTFGVGLG